METMEMIHKCENVSGLWRPFCEGGSVMYLIACVGFLTLYLILERAITLKKLSINKEAFTENLYRMVLRGDLQQAVAYCDSAPSPMTKTLKEGLIPVMNKRPDEEIQVAMDASVLRETPKIEGWTSFLAVFGNVSVLVGLLGTIIGLIRSFSGVSKADAATKATLLSQGDIGSFKLYSFWPVGGYYRHRGLCCVSDTCQPPYYGNDRKHYESYEFSGFQPG